MSRVAPEPTGGGRGPRAVAELKRRAATLVTRARLARDWVRRHPYLSIAAGSTLLTLLSALALTVFLSARRSTAQDDQLAAAMAAMDQGHYAYARQMAEQIRARADDTSSLGGGLDFVLGASAAYEAQTMWDVGYRSKFYLVAARYLEQARDQGWLPDREAEGCYLLGKSLQQSGQHAPSIPVLEEALALNPDRAVEIDALLSRANLDKVPANLSAALGWKQRQWDAMPQSDSGRDQVRYELAEIQYRLGDVEACETSLDSIPRDSPRHTWAQLLRARVALDQGDQQVGDEDRATQKYREAIEILRPFEATDAASSDVVRKASYLIGVALGKLRRYEEAQKQLSKTRRSHHGTPEALAAGLQEAEILRSLDQMKPALELHRQVLQQAGRPETYENPWVSLEQLRNRTGEAFDQFLEQQRFDLALALAQSFAPIIPRVRAFEAQAETHRAWGESLLRRARELPVSQADAARQQGREQLRQAGSTFTELADLRFSEREYTDDLWHSASSYLEGNDFTHAVEMFQAYLDNEMRWRRPNALVGMGKALLALDRIDASLAALEECIEFYPKDPAVYDARLQASRAYLERGDVERAKEYLEGNLHDESLTPQSTEWRDSQFQLGMILYREATILETQSRAKGLDSAIPDQAREALAILETSHSAYQASIQLLEEAVQRYPAAPQALDARYMIAKSHRETARLPERKYALTTIGPIRTSLRKQEQQALEQALASYHDLQVLLTKKQETTQLTPLEASILRNCYFGQGDALLSLGRYEEAIRVYSAGTSRYQQRPESMEAFVQIADCYRRLNRGPEARGTIEQAKVVLRRLDPDVDFSETTRYTRDEWTQLLDWMSTL